MATTFDSQRDERLWKVIHDVLQRRDRGESIPDAQVIALHPDLMPELANHLRRAPSVSRTRNTIDKTHLPSARAVAPTITGSSLPRDFGSYRLIELISHGSMGSVYRAVQKGNNREVAIKMIVRQELGNPEPIKRFEAEIKAASQLEHDNIVTVYEVGQEANHHFYSMQFIDGPSLSDLISKSPLTGPVSADILSKVAKAVHYAHQNGVVHRDIKPSNILLDQAARPYVSDFGLAKDIDGDSGLTQSGQVMGTASYMSPEQACGRPSSVGVRSDVYSLGAVFYEMLTRRPPFSAASVPLTLVQVIKDDPIPPRTLNPNVNPDLETICLKCLHKNPARRYGSAIELAQDLDQWKAGLPISARRTTKIERLLQWAKRESKLAAACALATVAIVSLIFALTSGYLSNKKEVAKRTRAQDELVVTLKKEEDVAHRAEKSLYLSRMSRAWQEWENGNLNFVRHVVAKCRQMDSLSQFQSFEWHYLDNLVQRADAKMAILDEQLVSVDWSNNGDWIAVGGELGTVYLFDGHTQEQLRSWTAHEEMVSKVLFSSNHTYLLTASEDGTVKVWSTHDFALVGTMKSTLPSDTKLKRVNDVVAFPDESTAITAGRDGVLRQRKIPSGELIKSEHAHDDHINHLALSPDAKLLVTTSRDKTVGLFDAASLKRINFIGTHREKTMAVCFNSYAGERLIVGDGEGHVVVRDAKTFEILGSAAKHAGSVSSIATWRNWIASSSEAGTIWLSSVTELRSSIRRGHTDYVTEIDFSPDGRLVSVSHDRTVRIWSPDAGTYDNRIQGHADTTWDIEFSPDGEWFGTCGVDGEVRVYRAANVDEAEWTVRVADEVNSLSFSTDSRLLACGSDDFIVHVWDTTTREHFELKGHQDHVCNVEFIGETDHVLSSSRDGTIRIWDTQSGQCVNTIPVSDPSIVCAAVSPDGKSFATGDGSGTVAIWDTETGHRLVEHQGAHDEQVLTISFSPDGQLLASGSRDGRVLTWETETASPPLQTLEVNVGNVRCVEFSPDGRCLATGGTDRIVRLWEPRSGEMRAAYRGHESEIYAIAFSSDGMVLATAGTSHEPSPIILRNTK